MRILTAAIVITTGMLSGFAGSLLAQRASAPPKAQITTSAGTADPGTPPTPAAQPESCETSQPPEGARAAQAAPEATAATSEHVLSSQELELEDAKDREQQERRLVAHAQEPRDPGWAREMESKVRGAFDQLARTGLRYSDLECRYTSCKLKVEWPDAQTAYREAKSVAMLREEPLPCTRFLTMDPPVAGRATQTASYFIDCQQARLDGIGGAQL